MDTPRTVYELSMGNPWTAHGLYTVTHRRPTDCPQTLHGRSAGGPRAIHVRPTPLQQRHQVLSMSTPRTVQDCPGLSMYAPRTPHGQSMGTSWTADAQPTHPPRAIQQIVHALSTDAPRTVHGLSTDCPRMPHRRPTDCPRTAHGLSTGCPQNVSEHPCRRPTECPRRVVGRPSD